MTRLPLNPVDLSNTKLRDAAQGRDHEQRLHVLESRKDSMSVARTFGNRATAGASSPGFTVSTEAYVSSTGDLRMSITPAKNVWWAVEYAMIVMTTDTTWVRLDYYPQIITGTTADGVTTGTHGVIPSTSVLNWSTIWLRGTFKLTAGVPYTVRPLLVPNTGAWTFWMNDSLNSYTSATSHVVGFW